MKVGYKAQLTIACVESIDFPPVAMAYKETVP